MPKPKAYERYPLSSLLVYNFFALVQYIIGVYLLYLVNPWLGGFMVLYVLFLEYKLLTEGCRHCYYFGKRCFGGRGKIAGVFFKKGDPKVFTQKKVKGKDLIPQMMLLVFPTVAGAWLLYTNFSYLILGLVVVPWLIWFIVTPQVYGKMACPHCKQGRICCPANEFFSKKFGGKEK